MIRRRLSWASGIGNRDNTRIPMSYHTRVFYSEKKTKKQKKNTTAGVVSSPVRILYNNDIIIHRTAGTGFSRNRFLGFALFRRDRSNVTTQVYRLRVPSDDRPQSSSCAKRSNHPRARARVILTVYAVIELKLYRRIAKFKNTALNITVHREFYE